MTTVHPLIRQLAYIRYAQGLTCRDLADRIGRSPATIYAWEHGRRHPNVPALDEWAGALGATLAANPPDAAAPDDAFTSLIVCAGCGRKRRHKAKGMCASCYLIEWRKAAS